MCKIYCVEVSDKARASAPPSVMRSRAQVEQVRAVYSALRENTHAAQLGFKTSPLVVAGLSAGGNLATAALLYPLLQPRLSASTPLLDDEGEISLVGGGASSAGASAGFVPQPRRHAPPPLVTAPRARIDKPRPLLWQVRTTGPSCPTRCCSSARPSTSAALPRPRASPSPPTRCCRSPSSSRLLPPTTRCSASPLRNAPAALPRSRLVWAICDGWLV